MTSTTFVWLVLGSLLVGGCVIAGYEKGDALPGENGGSAIGGTEPLAGNLSGGSGGRHTGGSAGETPETGGRGSGGETSAGRPGDTGGSEAGGRGSGGDGGSGGTSSGGTNMGGDSSGGDSSGGDSSGGDSSGGDSSGGDSSGGDSSGGDSSGGDSSGGTGSGGTGSGGGGGTGRGGGGGAGGGGAGGESGATGGTVVLVEHDFEGDTELFGCSRTAVELSDTPAPPDGSAFSVKIIFHEEPEPDTWVSTEYSPAVDLRGMTRVSYDFYSDSGMEHQIRFETEYGDVCEVGEWERFDAGWQHVVIPVNDSTLVSCDMSMLGAVTRLGINIDAEPVYIDNIRIEQ